MDHPMIARIALSILCATQGIATLAIDLNRTHATNPCWTGHARFHVVWQSAGAAMMALLELVLIFGLHGQYQEAGFYLAAILTAVSPLAFLIAFLCRKMFQGTLSDPNGIPPVRIILRGTTFLIDLNLVAVLLALLSLGIILIVY